MKTVILKYFPEELIRMFQTIYWLIRMYRYIFQL